MKKKIVSVIFILLIITIVVFAVAKIGTNKESSITGNELFDKDLAVKTQSIKIIGFDGIEHVIDNPDVISSISNLLVESSYHKISEDEYIEGFYNMDFITTEDTVSIGLTDSYLAYAGQQYKVISGSLADIVGIIDIELE